jgi:hypothetical protein
MVGVFNKISTGLINGCAHSVSPRVLFKLLVLNVVLGSYKALTDSILSYLVKSDIFWQIYGFKIGQTLPKNTHGFETPIPS